MEMNQELENFNPEEILEFEEESSQQEEPSKIQKGIDDFFKTQNKRFLIIKNYLFQPEVIRVIKPTGFSILTYLIYESKGSLKLTTTVDILIHKTNIQSKVTIVKYLKLLNEIQILDLYALNDTDINKLNKHDIIEIDLSKYYSLPTGYEEIKYNIFETYYIKLKEISWTIFCYFKKICFGKSKFRISQRAICESTGIGSEDTIHKYIQLLIDLNIISKIDNSKPYTVMGDYYEDNKPIVYRTSIQYQFNI